MEGLCGTEISASSTPLVLDMIVGLVTGARVRKRQAQLRQLQHLDLLVAVALEPR
jgi:hypothetical protein